MKLNIGSGGQLIEGWVHIDRGFTPETVERAERLPGAGGPDLLVQFELTDLPLPFDDGSVSQAVAHHSLCMLAENDLHALLSDVWRVLEPAGVLRVSSVDFSYAMRALARRDLSWFRDLGVPPGERLISEAFVWYLDWGGARKTILFSPEHLGVEFLEHVGFFWTRVAYHETYTTSSICDFDSRADESWFLEATKP